MHYSDIFQMLHVFSLLRQWVLGSPAEAVLGGAWAGMLWRSSERGNWGDNHPFSYSGPKVYCIYFHSPLGKNYACRKFPPLEYFWPHDSLVTWLLRPFWASVCLVKPEHSVRDGLQFPVTSPDDGALVANHCKTTWKSRGWNVPLANLSIAQYTAVDFSSSLVPLAKCTPAQLWHK